MGLLLLAIGTGGVKPCVPSFGGDQFSSDQVFLFYTTIIFHFLANNSFLFLLLYMQQWLQANLKVERFMFNHPAAPEEAVFLHLLLRHQRRCPHIHLHSSPVQGRPGLLPGQGGSRVWGMLRNGVRSPRGAHGRRHRYVCYKPASSYTEIQTLTV